MAQREGTMEVWRQEAGGRKREEAGEVAKDHQSSSKVKKAEEVENGNR